MYQQRFTKSFLIVVILASLLGLSLSGNVAQAAPPGQTALFSDNFDDGNASGWTQTQGTWSVVQDSGSFVYSMTALGTEGRSMAGSQSWTNYAVEARVKVVNFGGSNRVMLAGRLLDFNNYYAASLLNSNGGTLEIRRKISGSSTTLVSKAYPLSTGVWYTLRLEMSGSTLRMFVNGNLELTASDSSRSSGAIGLIPFRPTAMFDNVVVTTLGTGPTATRTNTQPGPTSTSTRTPTQSSGSQVLQAENASFGGGATADSNNAGFFGTGFINFPASGGFLQFNGVDGGSGGSATLQFRYALGVSSSRTGQLIVNGATQSITFTTTGSWTSWNTHTVNVNLNAGTGNTVRLQSNGQDLANIDQLTVTAGGSGPTATPTNTQPGPTHTPTRTPTATASPSRTPTQPSGSAIYVAPNGSDGAPGTISQPTTLTAAISRVQPGGTILMRGGTYNFSSPVIIARGNNGTSSARKQLFANAGETPVLNFSAMAEDSANRGLTVNGAFWHVRGLIVERAGDNGIYVGGSNNIIERCVTRFNRDTGLQLGRHSSSAPFAEWPANNLILSCESHDNRDSDGEDADGFAAKLTVGEGNVFRFDVAHNNIDDGWDLYTKTDTGAIGRVTIEDSIAFRNGTLSDGSTAGNGDRNGFKLGGEDIAVNHIVRRNLAYLNGKHGFTYNRNLGTIEMTANIAIDSEERNFNFDGGTSVFRNNVSCRSSSGTNDRIIGNDDGSNFWWMGSNSSRCSSYSGTFFWQFNADGSLTWGFR